MSYGPQKQQQTGNDLLPQLEESVRHPVWIQALPYRLGRVPVVGVSNTWNGGPDSRVKKGSEREMVGAHGAYCTVLRLSKIFKM